MADAEDFDYCPAGKPGVIDIGHDVRIRYTGFRDAEKAGLIESHPKPGGGRCGGTAMFAIPETAELSDRPQWRVESWDPLTLAPSLLCRTCGHHGFIRSGRWVPA